MREWFQAQLGSGFPAFAGSVISGTVALSEDALNELLALWLAETAASANDQNRPGDWRGSVRLINTARVKAENGRLLVEFEIVV